jgi:hypothetical protein
MKKTTKSKRERIVKQKAWAAIYADGKILHEDQLPMIYLQKTKPRVFREGVEILMIPIVVSYTFPQKKCLSA